jgi:hypothetical protein
MKKIIYLNLSESSENNLGDLKLKLQEIPKDKTLGWFLSAELLKRRDDVLFNKELSAEFKEGALQQITEITDLLFGSGVNEIQKLLTKKNKISVKVTEEDLFKNKVLKI